MTVQLSADDRRAVDLLLDSIASDGRPTRSDAGQLDQRVMRVSKLLDLLETWNVDDVPPDLTARTFSRIAGARLDNASDELNKPETEINPSQSA